MPLCGADFLQALSGLKKGSVLPVEAFQIKEGETSPPKRYNFRFHDPGYGKRRPAY